MVRRIGGSSLLTASEAAHLLSAHVNTVRRWSAQGKLPAYRIGPRGDRRYRLEDLRGFLIEQYNRLDLAQYTVTHLSQRARLTAEDER